MKPPASFDATTHDRTTGFTLIELMVAVSVAAILTAVAIPAFSNFMMNDRDSSQINALSSSFNYARSEAVKRNTPVGVQVCPSTDRLTCNAAAPWSSGWIVQDMDPTDTTPLLQALPALGGSNVLTATLGGATGVVFRSSGAVTAPVRIKICDPRGSLFARDVEVSAVGNIAVSQTPGRDANGGALVCP